MSNSIERYTYKIELDSIWVVVREYDRVALAARNLEGLEGPKWVAEWRIGVSYYVPAPDSFTLSSRRISIQVQHAAEKQIRFVKQQRALEAQDENRPKWTGAANAPARHWTPTDDKNIQRVIRKRIADHLQEVHNAVHKYTSSSRKRKKGGT